ncbi:hypothetical protein [Nodosilinea sp. LEGE 06152]|uniref:hypothetical protein n=1 Tax=Nodosilinea sp. LEGE 06152 TaxID=2777966 RepID=UPI001D13F537|nr:hypothetical protein [Nodosilinea sp. LEGE 06152]
MSTTIGPEGASTSVNSGANSSEPWSLDSAFPRPAGDSLNADPWVRALFTVSQRAAAKKRSPRPLRSHSVLGSASSTGVYPKAEAEGGAATPSPYSLANAAPQLANPLAPLRDRDRQALGDIFAHDQMATIEADILNRLSQLVPEPIWDVEPYEFLREFLQP